MLDWSVARNLRRKPSKKSPDRGSATEKGDELDATTQGEPQSDEMVGLEELEDSRIWRSMEKTGRKIRCPVRRGDVRRYGRDGRVGLRRWSTERKAEEGQGGNLIPILNGKQLETG